MSNGNNNVNQKEMNDSVLSITIGCATRLCSLEEDELAREEIENLWFSLHPDSYMHHVQYSHSGVVSPAFKHIYAKYIMTKDEFQDLNHIKHADMSKDEEAKIMKDEKAREFVSKKIMYDKDIHKLYVADADTDQQQQQHGEESANAKKKSCFFDGGNRVSRAKLSNLEKFAVRHGKSEFRRRNPVYGIRHPFRDDVLERSFCDVEDLRDGEKGEDIFCLDGPPDVLTKISGGRFTTWRVVYDQRHETHGGLPRQEAHFRMACTAMRTREHRWGWSQSYFYQIAAHLGARICTALSFIYMSSEAYTRSDRNCAILQNFEDMFFEDHMDACKIHYSDFKSTDNLQIELRKRRGDDDDGGIESRHSTAYSDGDDENDDDPDYICDEEDEEEEEQYFYHSDQSDDEESVIDEDPEYNRPKQKANLTDEQRAIIGHKPRKGQMIVIKALPGTGKTTTCVAFVKKRACEKRRKVLYTMLNVKMVGHTEQHLEGILGVECATFYALAMRFIWRDAGEDEPELVDSVILPSKYKPIEKDVNDTLGKFWLSDDDELDRDRHLVVGKGRSSSETRVGRIMQVAREVWSTMLNGKKGRKYTHQAYLKRFCTHSRSVQHIESNYNCILVDEAQDLPPVFIKFLLKLRRVSIYVVGDPHQQIYTFAGSQSVFRSVDPTHVFSLTRSFRFGSAVAKLGTDFIRKQKGEDIRMKGNPAASTEIKLLENDDDDGGGDIERFERWINDASKAGQEVCYIARKNSTVLEMMIYLIEKGRKFHVVGKPIEDLRKMVIGDVYKTDGWTQEDFREEIHGMVERGMQDQSSSFQSMTFVQNHSKAYLLEQCGEFKREAREGEEDEEISDGEKALPRVVLCSAHQSKGMEFDHVILASDFEAPPGEGGGDAKKKERGKKKKNDIRDVEEVNILFVALTRCIKSIWLNQELSDMWRLELKKQRNRAELKRCNKEENENRKRIKLN